MAYNIFGKLNDFTSTDESYTVDSNECDAVVDIDIDCDTNLCDEAQIDIKPNTDTPVIPGPGQKGAVQKFSKLAKSLEMAILTPPTSSKRCMDMSKAIEADYRQKKKKQQQNSCSSNMTMDPLFDLTDDNYKNISNVSFDTDDHNFELKLSWNTKIEKIEFSMYKTFSSLIEHISQREKIDPNLILLTCSEKCINPNDTPNDLIGFNVAKFITVNILDKPNSSTRIQRKSADGIEIKVQCLTIKKPLTFNIKKSEPLKVLRLKCAEELKCKAEQIKFKYDGELIDISSTPIDLNFEDGEVLDLIMQ